MIREKLWTKLPKLIYKLSQSFWNATSKYLKHPGLYKEIKVRVSDCSFFIDNMLLTCSHLEMLALVFVNCDTAVVLLYQCSTHSYHRSWRSIEDKTTSENKSFSNLLSLIKSNYHCICELAMIIRCQNHTEHHSWLHYCYPGISCSLVIFCIQLLSQTAQIVVCTMLLQFSAF